VLVTGGRGFLGAATLAELAHRGHETYAYDRHDGNDIGDPERLGRHLQGMDAVIHLAGLLGTHELFDRVAAAIAVNVLGTANVLEACQRVGARYVGITMPESGWANIYTATKHCATDLAHAWHRHRGVPVSHVRAFNAYGPGQKHGPGHPRKIVPTFASQAWAGQPIEVWGDGEQTVDLIHVDEVARMLVDALRFGDEQMFDAGTGAAVTVNEVAWMVLDITGSTAGVVHRPMRDGEDPDTKIVADGAGWDLLDWRPAFDYNQFTLCINWYREAMLNLPADKAARPVPPG
jgi:UDP-glucose 4-epimerase